MQSMSASGAGPISFSPLCSQSLPQVGPDDDSACLGLPAPVFRWDQHKNGHVEVEWVVSCVCCFRVFNGL